MHRIGFHIDLMYIWIKYVIGCEYIHDYVNRREINNLIGVVTLFSKVDLIHISKNIVEK